MGDPDRRASSGRGRRGHLGHPDRVAERVAEAEVDAVGLHDRLLGQVNPALLQLGVGLVGVVGDEEQVAAGSALGDQVPDLVGHVGAHRRRRGQLQQHGPVRVGGQRHGREAHRAELLVDLDLEAELPDVEVERGVLVEHVHGGDGDGVQHGQNARAGAGGPASPKLRCSRPAAGGKPLARTGRWALPRRMADIEGTYDELFTAVPSALAGLLDAGDAGASVAVFVGGEPVVDVWGGSADADRTIPWQRDTITNVWSVTKTMTALCALILADRGELDLSAPVARYWPEFAAAGKEAVLVRHLLAHTAGLPDWDGPVEELYDWPAATARLAGQAPLWAPGSGAGYHSLTQGFLVGEVVRRITGRSVGEFFAAEVAGPLGADFSIGLPAEHDSRVALSVPPPSRDEDFTASAPGGSARPTAGTAVRVRDGNGLAW